MADITLAVIESLEADAINTPEVRAITWLQLQEATTNSPLYQSLSDLINSGDT
jgi:hypothetical protein